MLKVVSQDVVHSWWIPELGGKVQAVPGYTNYTWFKISKPGIYPANARSSAGAGTRGCSPWYAVSPGSVHGLDHAPEAEIASANAAAGKARAKLVAGQGAAAVENPRLRVS